MAGGFKVASVAVLATLIALYTPLVSLNAYVSMLSEVVYEGPGYKVIYKPPLIPILSDDKTRVALNVKRSGKPIEFGYTLSGITFDGALDVARGRGYGRAVADMTSYVDEVARTLREANSNPGRSGVGLLAFIVSKVEENGEEYVATDVISIPVIPGKARGKSIVVEVEFKPVHRVKLSKAGGGEQAGRVDVAETTPPGHIEDYCWPAEPYGSVCYYWELNKTYIDPKRYGPQGIPIITAYIDSIDGDYIKDVVLDQVIFGSDISGTLSFELSLAFKGDEKFFVPGPGFVIETTQSEDTLFDFACRFSNSKLYYTPSSCSYENIRDFSIYSFIAPSFYDEALLAIGLWGSVWLVEYDYVKLLATGSYYSVEVIDKSFAVYLVPHFRPDGMPDYWYSVDDNPYDGLGYIERVYKWVLNGYTSFTLLPPIASSFYDIKDLDITKYSDFPGLRFDIAIPVGAIALATLTESGVALPAWASAIVATLAIGASEDNYYIKVSFHASRDVTFQPGYLQVDRAYIVYEAGRQVKVPFMILWPYVMRAPA